MSFPKTASGYYHSTRGRLRVRVHGIKNRVANARSLELLMMSEPGITHVRANPVTGNVLICFKERTTYDRVILEALANLGHMPLICEKPDDSEAEAMCDLAMEIGRQLAKSALKRALVGSPVLILLELL